MLWQPGTFGGVAQPRDHWRRPQTTASAAAYSFRGSFGDDASSATITTSIDIGTASADRLIIVAGGVQNPLAITSVVVNGVTLNVDIDQGSMAFASGLVTSGSGSQTVAVTWNGSGFNSRTFFVWAATGLASNVVKHTGSAAAASSPASINVTAGDFLFANTSGLGTPNFSSSTETPANSNTVAKAPINSNGSDWTVVSTNASFSVVLSSTAGSIGIVAASYA